MATNYGTVIHYMNGMAICEDIWGELFYLEIPEEYAELGSAVDMDDLTPITALESECEQAVRAAVAAIPEDLHKWAIEVRIL